ncbi:hypothetical protein [Ulvibacterium marinum]|nr:hypothetical protein [Ulvibacterium marinum]
MSEDIIKMVVKGDVYVADQFGVHVDGPTIADGLMKSRKIFHNG